MVMLTEFPSENGAVCLISSAAFVGLFYCLSLVNICFVNLLCVFALLLMGCNCLFVDLIISRFRSGEITRHTVEKEFFFFTK